MKKEEAVIDNQRIRVQIPSRNPKGKYIVYWMQQAQRADYNPALDYAIYLAQQSNLPLLVLFVFTKVPDAVGRHYLFMMEGLWELAQVFKRMKIEFYCLAGYPPDVLSEVAQHALELVTDMGYLDYQRKWRSVLQEKLRESGTGYTQIETEPLIPVEVVSVKEEYSAATIRKKITRQISSFTYSASLNTYSVTKSSDIKFRSPFCQPAKQNWSGFCKWVFASLELGICLEGSSLYKGGRSQALGHFKTFLNEKLQLYATKRNEPALNIQSNLSPYLHFGQISTMEIIQQLCESGGFNLPQLSEMIEQKKANDDFVQNFAAFAEELIVRRELSFNFCHFNRNYDNFNCLPNWSKQTLISHLTDKREAHYSLDRLLQCATDDPYWNAAQKEMMEIGKMHNYMRMYWGKRLLAWFESPEEAYQVLLYLNNTYELDGRDPNGYAGIAWCFGKHDRPWQNRSIYGSVRYMNAAGLNRKFDMKAYLIKQGL